jgi:hypothetical protein
MLFIPLVLFFGDYGPKGRLPERPSEQGSQADLELAPGEAIKGDIAVLFGEDIGKARCEAVIVKAPVQQGKGQHRRVVAAGFAEGGQDESGDIGAIRSSLCASLECPQRHG